MDKRIEMAEKLLGEIDEGDPRLICWNVARETGLSTEAVARIMWPAPRASKPAPRCHYCGQPATSYGFFNEHACRECGG